MEGLILRAAGRRDIGDICRVWERSFGDGPETVKELLEPVLENTVAAELDGGVRALMAAFDGLDWGNTCQPKFPGATFRPAHALVGSKV